MESGADGDRLWWRATPTEPGDYVELLAQSTVVASVNPCADDLFGASAFEVAPVRVGVRAATSSERTRWLAPAARRGRSGISVPLHPISDYTPRYRRAALTRTEVTVDLADGDRGRLDALRCRGTYCRSDAEIVRSVLFRWWQDHHARSWAHS